MQLDEVSNHINELIVGHPANKKNFCEHIEKVIREAEKHRQYLLEQSRKAKEAGWVFYDKSKDKDKWTWSLNAYSDICKHTYFTEDEQFSENEIPSVQFYIEGKPEPNPLSYLESMLWGSVGQVYEGLELLDYQFILLAIIHDAQNWQAGRERIYFNPLEKKTLSDRLCQAICHRLEKIQHKTFGSEDVHQTIETALRAVKAELAKAKQTQDEEGELDSTTQPEARQKASRKNWVSSFFWKLYEKTLKVVVDAILEKWVPK